MREKSFDEELLEEEMQNQQLIGKTPEEYGVSEMEETKIPPYGKKKRNVRKDIIKNVIIVFLVVMLLLTLFSNTIMNYSLVEVNTQMIYGNTITSKVRGSGTVEAGENYFVTLDETRKIKTINVRTGATVEKGDSLLTLDDSESEELKTQRAALAEAESAYETAVITAGITVAQRNAIESGNLGSLTEKQTKLDAAQAEVDSAQALVDSLTKQAASSSKVDTTAEEAALIKAQQDKIAADAAVNAAMEDMNEKKAAYEEIKALGGTEEEIAQAKGVYESALQAYIRAQQNVIPYEQAVSNAQTALQDKLSQTNSTQLADAQRALEAATAKRDALSAQIVTEINLSSQYEALAKLREEVAKMESEAASGDITSPIAGTVTDIYYTAGQTPQIGDTIMSIQPENKAFVVKFTVTADQAKKIKPGDEAKILNNWSGDDITAVVSSVRKNKEDKNVYDVTCELSGEVSVGSYYTLSIGEKSANYDMVVPTSCIREDSNGKFIYIIESKSTPLGNRYYARHVEVQVLASDDTYSAIAGALQGYEYVITTTTKPVEDNQQVRLAD